ncbi:MAG TPA: methyltransferase domain-containing protein [Gemmatimonadales bacterium]|nr:methyltransferase domain-containing protein [Gemmatimonadales bacterium]
MSCCGAPGCERIFDRKHAARELKKYRADGPMPTTKALIGVLLGAGMNDDTLLDIGGGVGAIQYALLAAGARTAVSVDASAAFEAVARAEAERQGVRERIRYESGDFVEIADRIAPADIVTLDRVVCCYPNMESLVRLSAARCRRLYGLVYPRDRGLIRVVIRVQNFFRGLFRNPFRSYVHSVAAMDDLIRSAGFTLRRRVRTFVWEVAVYEK